MTTTTAPRTKDGTPQLSPRAQALFSAVNDGDGDVALETLARQHPAIFLDAYARVYDPSLTKELPFHLWDWQWDFLAHVTNHKKVVILKARQLGVSWLLAGYALWTAIFHPNVNILLVSRKEDVASDLLKKAVFIYDRLPPSLKLPMNRRRDKDNATERSWSVINSRILALASSKETGRSETATLVIPDEWAFHPEAAEMYSGYSETVGQEGQIVGCSTANGVGNLFANLYQGAKKGDNDFFPIFLPWHLRPGRDAFFYDAKRREFESIGEPWKLQVEYPSNDVESFLGSFNTYFDIETLVRVSGSIASPTEVHAYDKYGNLLPSPSDPSSAGLLRLWAAARPGQRYTVGADVAEGGAEGNRSAAVILEARTGRHVASLKGHWTTHVYAGLLVEVARLYGDALLAVERNNHGHAVLEALTQTHQYPHLYSMERRLLGRNSPSKLGWQTNSATRQVMFADLRSALADGSFFTQDEEWVQEAYTFGEDRWGRPAATPGNYDDLMAATAIAWQAKDTYAVVRRSYRTVPLAR